MKVYFRDGVEAMRQMLSARGFKRSPVIYLNENSTDGSNDELKDSIGKFFKTNARVIFFVKIKNSS